jgi:hypothetical protein
MIRRVIKERFQALMRDRRITIIAGLLLVLVPTLFSVFPEWARWDVGVRIAVMAAWAGTAMIVVTSAARQGEQLEDLVGTPFERRSDQRFLSGARLMRSLLTHETGLPAHYEFRVFLYDGELNKMIAAYEPDDVEKSEGWDIGHGATGEAWDRKEYVIARGDAVHDGTYNLSPEQQERYRDLEVVAAMPVRNAREQVIAILTGSSKNDDGVLANPEGYRRQRELSEIVARILIDILREGRD